MSAPTANTAMTAMRSIDLLPGKDLVGKDVFPISNFFVFTSTTEYEEDPLLISNFREPSVIAC